MHELTIYIPTGEHFSMNELANDMHATSIGLVTESYLVMQTTHACMHYKLKLQPYIIAIAEVKLTLFIFRL